ncbi:hypothetical protein SAMN06297387_11683 [Streptomyces zhaozhouensis]|uniref:Uncharacterized protein n=1 Tax=Streptomyces zhaozhouensis TaxID=1300267 RepID=A0A286E0C9_9ACTN|nr:hypothetical protein [Streptomyces zhaozhouensis]SOD64359.1 hypothetical protein SAMN06297387_11683 [Streptomyces zhaozhouensis]
MERTHREEDDDANAHNEINGGDIGQVGQFGSVYGSVNFNLSERHDPDELQRAFRDALRERDREEAEARRRSERERKEAELAEERAERFTAVVGYLVAAGLLFALLHFVFDLWWQLSLGVTVVVLINVAADRLDR